jgi:hypothetical protein
MWWLCFQRDGRLFGVAIVEASSAVAARLRASLEGLGAGGAFTQGIQLTVDMVKRLTPEDIGRMLSPAEAETILKRFDRAALKKPAASSIKRRAQTRVRQA